MGVVVTPVLVNVNVFEPVLTVALVPDNVDGPVALPLGVALIKYSERYQIPLDEFICFGDMENDIGLLKEAGWGVCLVNGSDATKAVAQAVTEYPVEEDGVGRYLEDHWFNR